MEYYSLEQASKILRAPPSVIIAVLVSGRVSRPLQQDGRLHFTLSDLASISEIINIKVVPRYGPRGDGS